MRSFALGILLGATLVGGGVIAADKDPLGIGRSQQQRTYDYYREYGQRLDIEHARKQLDRQRFQEQYGSRARKGDC